MTNRKVRRRRLSVEGLEKRMLLFVPLGDPPVINEFLFNHVGTDTMEFIEIFGEPNTDYGGMSLLVVEGDASNAGKIDNVYTLGTTDSNGFQLFDSLPANSLENGTQTVLLVNYFTGSVGDDLDTNNDGIFDSTPWTTIFDDVAVDDGGSSDQVYSTVILDGGLPPSTSNSTPGGASRIPNGTDTNTSADWLRNDFDLAGFPSFPGTPLIGEAFNTPGATNQEVVAPNAAPPIINEFVFNHDSTDTQEFIEIFGDPNTNYVGAYTALVVEGDSSGAGTIDRVYHVTQTDSNGYQTFGFFSNSLENGTQTILLVENFTGTQGMDLDTNNDGTLDVTPWTSRADDVAVSDGGSSDYTYSSTVLTSALPPSGNSSPPGGASRIPNGTDTNSVSDWTRNDFDRGGFPSTFGTPEAGEAFNTPNAANRAVQEFLVNEFTDGFQMTYAETRNIATNESGDTLVTWAGRGPGDSQGIFGQWFSNNTPVGPQTLINVTTSGNQRYPSAAVGPAGDSAIAWSGKGSGDNDGGVFVRLYDDTGSPTTGEILVNQTTASFQQRPVVAKGADGSFIVTWSGKGTGDSSGGVFARRFSSTGTPLTGEFLVNTTTSNKQEQPDIAIASDGSFIITWAGRGMGDSSGVFFQRYDSSGAPIGHEMKANTSTSGIQSLPSVGIDGANNFTVVWSGRGSGDSAGVFSQRYNASGSPVGSEELVNTTTLYDQSDASISVAPSGRSIITWSSLYQDGSGRGVFAQEYDSTYSKVGGEQLINETTFLDQKFSSVAVQGEKGYSVVWTGRGVGDTSGIFSTSRKFMSPPPPLPLTAAGGIGFGAPSLTTNQLDTIVAAAIQRLDDAGLADAQLSLLSSVDVQIADLPGDRLGEADGSIIRIDVNAAGFGWFVDATPLDDAEFVAVSQHELTATLGGGAEGKMDLLTTVLHEMGHVLGLEHGREDALLGETLDTGTRHTLDEFFHQLGELN